MFKIRSLIILLLLLYFNSFSQGIIYLKPQQIYPNDLNLINITWNEDYGLPTKNIYDIKKTKVGFIWLATDEGLIRFDGTKFKVFNRRNVTHFSRKFVTHLFVDAEDNLWFNDGNLGLLKRTDNNFAKVTVNSFKKDFKNISDIKKIKNKLYIASRSMGLIIIEDDKYTLIDTSYGFKSNRVNNFYVSGDSVFISVFGEGIYLFNRNKLLKPGFNKYLSSRFIKVIKKDRKGNLWFGSEKGLDFIKSNNYNFVYKYNALKSSQITSIEEDINSNIWIGTKRMGLMVIPKNKLFQFHKQSIIPENYISKIHITDNNEIWFATKLGGLHLLYTSMLSVVTKNDGLLSDYVQSIYRTKDNKILCGTDNGIIEIDQNGKVLKTLIKDVSVMFLAEDNKGDLFAATKNDGIYILKKGKVVHIAGKDKLGVNYIRAVIRYKDKMLIGTNGNGLLIYKNERIIKKISIKEGLSSRFISTLNKTKSGKILVGTSGGGLNILDSSYSIKIISKKEGLLEDLITSFIEDEKGVLWITTNGGGISRIENNNIINITENEGLYKNSIYTGAIDKQKRFWFTTKKGVFYVNKNDLDSLAKGKLQKIKTVVYKKNDGMLSEETMVGTSQGIMISKEGNVFVATYKGLVIIDPKKKIKPEHEIYVYIDEIKANDSFINLKKNIVLQPDIDKLEFNLSGVDYRFPKDIIFKYQMVGLSNQWVMRKSRGNVTYFDLPPGKYTFKVTAKSYRNDWSEKITSINIIKLPYFWQTFLFRISITILLFFLIILTVRYLSTRKLKNRLIKLEAEHALEHERMRISKDMHDELGSVLTKINLLSEIAKRDKNDIEKLDTDLDKLSFASREVADTMDEIVWAVSPQNDNLENMLGYIAEKAEEYLSITNIKLQIKIPQEIPEYKIKAEIRHNLFMVIKEALNNIVKHSKADKVEITTNINSQGVSLKIKDNGKGIDFDNIDKFSNGIKNMKNRIKEIGGELIVENIKPNGVQVYVNVKFKNHTFV